MPKLDTPAQRGPSAVVIEDHPLIAQALCDLLQSAGWAATRIANSIDEGVALCASSAPDMVTLDLQMDRGDGFDNIARVRSAAPSSRVIVVSARDRPTDVAESRLRGASGYVSKQGSAEQLAETFRVIASGHEVWPWSHESPREADTVVQRRARQRGGVAAALEIVGSYCHDIGNSMHSCLLQANHTGNGQLELAIRKALLQLRTLSAFTHSYGTAMSNRQDVLCLPDMEAFVAEICARELDAGQTSYALDVDIDIDRKGGSTSRVLVDRTLTPLLQNAVDSLRESQPSQDAIPHVSVRVLANPLEGALEIQVRDRGAGFGEKRDDLLRALRRGENYSTKGPERGMGLLLLHKLVRQFDGTFDVSDEDGWAFCRVIVPLWSAK